MVTEELAAGADRFGVITRVARQLGIGTESLRNWVRQAQDRSGSAADKRRIAELERENRELRRANEILKAASAYFATELDPTRRRS
jgi:transposase